MSKVINMNALKEARVKTVEIPEVELSALRVTVAALAKMHLELIRLYEEESHLKKHHKAYLHIRDHADQVCKEDKEKVNAMLQQFIQGDFDYENTPVVEEREFDPEDCRGCADYDECKKAAEEDGLDVFALPEGLVVMSTEDLGVMQDDMLALTETVDHLVSVYRGMMSGKGVDMKEMFSMLEGASKQSQEVFKRWDDAGMMELA